MNLITIYQSFQRRGLTAATAAALKVIHEGGTGVTQGQLAQALKCTRSNVTGIRDRLKKLGLVVSLNIAGDRRERVTSLTAEGKAAIEAIKSELRA